MNHACELSLDRSFKNVRWLFYDFFYTEISKYEALKCTLSPSVLDSN